MILWWISLIIFFFENHYLEIAKAKYIIQMDVEIQLDVPNHNHNASVIMPQHKLHSTVKRKLVSNDGNGQKYKVHKTKSRSLTEAIGPVDDVQNCCKEKEVPHICYRYCKREDKTAVSRLEVTGICSTWLDIVSECQKDVIHSGDVLCKDYSHRCMTLSARSCMMPILADVCKRSCGLCHDNQLQFLPPSYLRAEYGEPLSTMWCKHNMGVEGRNGCMSHKQCLDNARGLCDNDPGCYGVSWYPTKLDQKIKLCLSRDMEPKHDGWRTMMKSGGPVPQFPFDTPR